MRNNLRAIDRRLTGLESVQPAPRPFGDWTDEQLNARIEELRARIRAKGGDPDTVADGLYQKIRERRERNACYDAVGGPGESHGR